MSPEAEQCCARDIHRDIAIPHATANRHMTDTAASPRKRRDRSAVAGHIGASGAERRRGRKSALEAAERPFSVAARSDTHRYFMSYTGAHPETGEYGRWKLNLVPVGESMATTDRTEADRLAAEIWRRVLQKTAQKRRGEVYVGPKSFPALAVLYCEHLKTDTVRAPRGLKSMQLAIERALEFTCLGSEEDVTTMTVKTVRTIKAQLRQAVFPAVPRIPRPHHPSANQVAFVLRNVMYMLEWVQQEQIPDLKNVVHSSGILRKTARAGRGEEHFYNPIEIAAILQRANEQPKRLDNLGNSEILHVDFYQGSRSIEALLLRPCDVDFRKNTLRLVTAKQHRYVDGEREWFDINTPADVDRLQLREVKMWPRLRAILWAYAERHRLYEQKWPWFFPDYAAADFRVDDPRTHRRRLKGPYSFLKTVIRHAAKELPGLVYRGFHVGRHAYISARRHMYMPVYNPQTGLSEPKEVSLSQIQTEVGHADGSEVTMKVYNKVRYRIPPNTLYDLDWDALAKLCREAEEKEKRHSVVIGLPADVAARYCPVASHPKLQAQLAQLPVVG